MLNLIFAALVTIASPSMDTTSCVPASRLVGKIQDTGLQYVSINDKGTLQAIKSAGYKFEAETVLVIAVNLPDDTTLVLEFDAQGCMLPSGPLPTPAWRLLLERSQA